MESSIVFCSAKKVAYVGTEVASSIPVSEFIRSCGGSKFLVNLINLGR